MGRPSGRVCAMVDRRDGYRCVRCGRSLASFPGSRHHRRMRSQSDRTHAHDVENLILLCGSGTTGCHGWVHAHPADAYALGLLVHSYEDPAETPVDTWFGRVTPTPDGGYRKAGGEQPEPAENPDEWSHL